MRKYTSQLKPITPSRLGLANRRGSRLSTPGGFATVEAESFNFSTLNQIFYQGRRDRIQRYDAYDQMDMDADIHRALDIIAEHCTAKDSKTSVPFKIVVENDNISYEDSETLFEMMSIWNKHCDWDNLAFRSIRNTIKYGDFFFIRDNETFDLYPISPRACEGVFIDEETSEIQAYMFVNLKKKFKFMSETNTELPATSQYRKGRFDYSGQQDKGTTYSGIIDAKHIIHLSMSEGKDVGGNGQNTDIWPFGNSMLERVYKDFKARSLLEDAEVIHRIQRAPSRRVFYIDVGKARGDKANSYARKVKNELMQKRIPSMFGGQNAVDSVYNPISQMEDLYLTVTADGRGTKVENLEGQAWSDEGPLKYFYNKVHKGLGIPVSYMSGPEDQGQTYNDGRIGTAYLQEFQFANMCERIQDLLDNNFDSEFKIYLDFRGIHINSGSFEIKFVKPMNFAEYREAELNDTRLNLMSSALSISHLSKRWAMRRFGNMTDDDVLENEHMYMEEQMGSIARQYDQENEMGGMGVGMSGLDSSFGSPMGGDFGDEMGGTGMDGPAGMGGGGMAGGSPMGGAQGGPGGGMAGGSPMGGPGMESFINKGNKKVLQELFRSIQYSDDPREKKKLLEQYKTMRLKSILTEETNTDDLEIVPNKPTEPSEVGDDRLYLAATDDEKLVSISHVRKLRIERERNRVSLIKRLYRLKTIYGSSDTGGGFGF